MGPRSLRHRGGVLEVGSRGLAVAVRDRELAEPVVAGTEDRATGAEDAPVVREGAQALAQELALLDVAGAGRDARVERGGPEPKVVVRQT